MSPSILCFQIFKASLLRDYVVNYTQSFRDSSLCNGLSIFRNDFLPDKLENDGLMLMREKNVNKDSLILPSTSAQKIQ